MKKSLLRFLTSLLVLLTLLSAFAGCRPGNDSADTTEHTHAYGDWETSSAVACTENFRRRICADCGEEETETLAPTQPHTYENGVCTACGASYFAVTGKSVFFTPTAPADGVSFHTPEQAAFLKDTAENIFLYATGEGKTEMSKPLPITFSWEILRAEGGAAPTGYTLRVSEQPDLAGAWTVETETTSAEVYNLKIGTRYYWTVTAKCGETVCESPVYEFTTDGSWPRNLNIGGVTNCRDVGGFATENGGRVRQGLLYRTGRLNPNEIARLTVSKQGQEALLRQLGIRSEIDLRRTDNHESGTDKCLLSDSVTYFAVPITNAKDIGVNKDQIKKVFQILADEKNYPILFHCSIGTDRTGLIAFLVNGLLGVPEDQLYMDYVFSNFGQINAQRPASQIQASDHYVAQFKKQPGSTLSEQIRNYLLSIGVTDAELDSIIRILREEPVR